MTPLQLPDPLLPQVTVATYVPVKFPWHMRWRVKNSRKAYPLGGNGDLYDFIFEELQGKHEPNGRTWTAKNLKRVYWDIEMQQQAMGGRFRTRVILTALLNLHKRMVCWSNLERAFLDEDGNSTMHRTDLEMSVAEDFRGVLHESVFDVAWNRMRRIVEQDEVEQDGRDRDQTWILQVDAFLRESGMEGSTHRIFQMKSPRDFIDWHGPTGPDAESWVGNPLPPVSSELWEILFFDNATGRTMADPPVLIWKKKCEVVLFVTLEE